MLDLETALSIKLARTLWHNTYRARVSDSLGNYVATLRLVPTLPLDRSELPPDAPEADPYLTVLVEDGAFDTQDITAFESKTAETLIAQMAQHDFEPSYCMFAYPSPLQLMTEQPHPTDD
ncbi:MAG: hypothetical protein P4N59_27000 [Negativicutes bacterium]|nr:hypothetical protein [Negativicutes bacterium]